MNVVALVKKILNLECKMLDCPHFGVQILSILCSFGEIWQNRMLAPPFEGLAPPPGEILEPPMLLKGQRWQIGHSLMLGMTL